MPAYGPLRFEGDEQPMTNRLRTTYWDSVRKTGNVFVSVKFWAGSGVENADRGSRLTLRRLPYLRRMETPRSTVSAVQRNFGTNLCQISHRVGDDRTVSELGIHVSHNAWFPYLGYRPSAPSLNVLKFG